MEEQNQQQTPQPEKPKSKKDITKKRKIIGIVIWVIIGITVGIWSSAYRYNIIYLDDYCSTEDIGFPVKVIDDWNNQYNFELKLNINPNVIPVANAQVKVDEGSFTVLSECGWNRDGRKNDIYISGWSINTILNILIFVLFFVFVEFLVWKKSLYYLYLLNPIFVGLLYIIFGL